MTEKEKNIAGLAQFAYIAYEYYQSAEEELIRIGELHNSNKYRERFAPTTNKRTEKLLTKKMNEENKHLRKSLGLFGKHLRGLVDKMDNMTSGDKFQETNEELYKTFERCINRK